MTGAIKIEVIGSEKLKKTLSSMDERFRKQAFVALVVGATAIQGEARRMISDRSTKSGEIYHRKDKRPTEHQASAPGEAPANWEGGLRSGIKVYTDEGKTTVYVASSAIDPKSGVDYAPLMELGSDGGKIKKRPYLAPSFKKFKPLINQSIKAAIKAAKKG